MPPSTKIPAEIELVLTFVNTAPAEAGEADRLADPPALGAWLTSAGLIGRGTPASGRDVKLALRLRAALRQELLTHHGRKVDGDTVAALDEVCCDLPLRAVCGGQGLAPASGGTRGALAQLMAAATAARIKGTWTRLKVCPAEDCGRAFYDTSRNRSRRWCSMEVCGNRSKVRAFRDRNV